MHSFFIKSVQIFCNNIEICLLPNKKKSGEVSTTTQNMLLLKLGLCSYLMGLELEGVPNACYDIIEILS